MNKSKFLRCFITLATLFLLPLGAFADPQLSTSLQVSSCWEDSSITNGQCQNYSNNQAAPPGTSLSDSGANSEDPWAHAACSVQLFYGSASMTGSGAAVESQSEGILGSGSNSATAQWTSQLTINSSGLEGQQATVRMTFRASGDASGSASSYLANSGVGYGYSVSDGQNGASFNGSWNPTDGWTGDGAPTRTFTFDATCTVGQPCEIAHSVSLNVGAGTGEPDFGDPQTCDAQGTGSLHFSSGDIQVLDPSNDNQPVSYTMTSNVGCGAGQVLAAGAPYGGFSVTNCADDRFGSTFSLLDGAASQNTNVIATFVAPLVIKAASDVVDLTGTDGDLQVVQIDWNPGFLDLGPLQYLGVVFIGHANGTRWVSGTFGNYNGPPPTFFERAYNPATDFHLGYQGVDNVNHVAWAVINHNSLFAVGIPFDLVSVVSRKTHGAAGTFDINMPLTGTAGIECRNAGAGGSHTLVFTFKSNLASGEVFVTGGGGSISGTPTMTANTMTVNLTGVTNAQRTTLTLHNMKDVANQELPDTSITVGFLLGDTTGNGSVGASDISQTKLQAGQPITAANFRTDVNASGSINGTDVSLVKLNSGTALP